MDASSGNIISRGPISALPVQAYLLQEMKRFMTNGGIGIHGTFLLRCESNCFQSLWSLFYESLAGPAMIIAIGLCLMIKKMTRCEDYMKKINQ